MATILRCRRRRLWRYIHEAQSVRAFRNTICCKAVTAIAHSVRRKGLDHVIAFLVCTLLVIFAVGAKVAVYHPTEPGVRVIAAAKAWQAKQMPVDAEPLMDAIIPQTDLALTVLLSLCVVIAVIPREDKRRGFHSGMEYCPSVAVRPPPAF